MAARKRDSVAAEAAFRARLEEIGATLLEPEWLGSQQKHRVKCAKGHECSPCPSSVQRGQGICRVCAGNDSVTAEAAFRARLTELGATLLGDCWLGSMTPHHVRCAKGHECSPRPNDVQRGIGICRICAGNDPETAEAKFRVRITELGGVVLGTYKGVGTPVLVQCAKGHECNPWPNSVQQGKGICRICVGQDPATAEAAFRARVADLGGVVLGTYENSRAPVLVQCVNGHEATPRPESVQQGQGICRFCAGMEFDVFYLVASERDARIQPGVTSNDHRSRLGEHRRAGYHERIRIIENFAGAYELEQHILRTLKSVGYKPVKGKEIFDDTEDVRAIILDVVDNWPLPSDARIIVGPQITAAA